MVPGILFIEQPYIHILHLHMVLHGIALSCTISHYLALSRTILYYIALSWTILNYLALSCTILHHPVVPIRYTCSQHMSPVIAFDIAAVAHKVRVQYWGTVWSEKVGWWWWWVSSRSGWLLDLLTELMNLQIANFVSPWTPNSFSQSCLKNSHVTIWACQ